ncbi:MAG TPA: tonB-system energizer ExbB [Pseudolabrys sp.]|jgi:biopolymer transport protein ExbB|nr:tonB-system energizer ExbB [Pseudolabrys sp.]
MTSYCQKHRALVAAIVAAVLILPAPVAAQTAPAATTSSSTVPQAAPTPAAPAQTPNSAAPGVTDPATAAPPAPTQALNSPDIVLKLPRDLSPWGMFMAADIVVKAVMVGLVFASVLTWTIWFAKAIELMFARRRMRAAIEKLGHAKSWNEANVRTKGQDVGVAALLRAADIELRMSADAHSSAGIKERIASRLERLEAAAGRQMIRGTGILATIGATAPFVGLFGTVWGIMNSFIGISKSHTTNLAVVAPGIAEALLATALGLVAAIPAVVMYNMFSRWIAGYRALHADAAAEILRIVSRDLDRGAFDQHPAERRRAIAAE